MDEEVSDCVKGTGSRGGKGAVDGEGHKDEEFEEECSG